tara:strand:- start:433 stop:543 length:111 start_codon:yes stop_codon:yes gene_type:complete
MSQDHIGQFLIPNSSTELSVKGEVTNIEEVIRKEIQ